MKKIKAAIAREISVRVDLTDVALSCGTSKAASVGRDYIAYNISENWYDVDHRYIRDYDNSGNITSFVLEIYESVTKFVNLA